MQTSSPRKILIIAAESSGDRLAARVVREAKRLAAERGVEIMFDGIGGDGLIAEGMHCRYTPKQMSVVGFLEVAKRYGFFRRVFNELVALLDDPKTKPDTILLVDYPGFNIRYAAEAKKRGIEVIYYVSPQVWAWKPSRVQKIVASVSRMLVIFPFEVDIYTQAGLSATAFVGHPLVGIIDEERRSFSSREDFAVRYGLDASKKWLLVFPGSRSEEVRRHLHIMSAAAQLLQKKFGFQPVIVESANLFEHAYSDAPNAMSRFRDASHVHELMHHASFGILKSGTTTLEAALIGLPGVICYRTSWPTYMMARMLVKLDMIGLANIVLGKKLYPELIQQEMTSDRISEAIASVVSNEAAFRTSLADVRMKLQSDDASPSLRVAEYLFEQ